MGVLIFMYIGICMYMCVGVYRELIRMGMDV